MDLGLLEIEARREEKIERTDLVIDSVTDILKTEWQEEEVVRTVTPSF
jgi:hypothetical protein